MEAKKGIKMSVLMFFLMIAIIVILVMGYFLYMSNSKTTDMVAKEKELNAKIENLENEASNKNEENIENNVTLEKAIEENNVASEKVITENNAQGMSFSDFMDRMYTKNKTKIGENSYASSLQASAFALEEDVSGNLTNIEYTRVNIYNGEISFEMKGDKEIARTIEGISEEVVSIKILQEEGNGTPSVICFLTRLGNVYYIDREMINSNIFTAKKLTNLKEIVSIEIAETTYSGSMHSNTTLIATTYNGEKIDILTSKLR